MNVNVVKGMFHRYKTRSELKVVVVGGARPLPWF